MAAEFSFVNVALTEVAKWGVPLIGGLVAVFFTPLIDTLKLRLNRVELRVKQYEEFAKDLSSYVFEAEIQHEFRSSTWASSEDMTEVIRSYNLAITTLRSKEIVYLSWAERYWGSNHLPAFRQVLSMVKQVDAAVHAFNDGKKTKERLNTLAERTHELREASLSLLAPSKPRKPPTGA